MVNKDTLIFASFSKSAGNAGCVFFNNAFDRFGINAIYKSFSVNKIQDAVMAARTLGFAGFAISMPFKKDVVSLVDEVTTEVMNIGAANTVVNKNGVLTAYNTDYLAAMELLSWCKFKDLYILGCGGYSLAVQYAASLLGLRTKIIDRTQWDSIQYIRNSIIYNCTPAEITNINSSNEYINCLISSKTGERLSNIQASYQFSLYTGRFINYDK